MKPALAAKPDLRQLRFGREVLTLADFALAVGTKTGTLKFLESHTIENAADVIGLVLPVGGFATL